MFISKNAFRKAIAFAKLEALEFSMSVVEKLEGENDDLSARLGSLAIDVKHYKKSYHVQKALAEFRNNRVSGLILENNDLKKKNDDLRSQVKGYQNNTYGKSQDDEKSPDAYHVVRVTRVNGLKRPVTVDLSLDEAIDEVNRLNNENHYVNTKFFMIEPH